MHMDFKTRYQLWKLKKMAQPSSVFAKTLEKKLRIRMGHGAWWVFLKSESRRIAIATMSGIFLIGGGTGVYAYTSDNVTPDHPLYVLRTAMENVEMATSFKAERRAYIQRKQELRHQQDIARMKNRK